MHRLLAPFPLLLLAGFALAGALGVPPSDAAPADLDTQVSRVVTGIIGYARWPSSTDKLRFCIAGQPAHLKEGLGRPGQIGEQVLSYRRIGSDEADWSGRCDILFLGALPAAERKKFLDKAVGRPVLSISENDAVCAEPTMFCLPIQAGEVGLRANLDAISRSGIRINPKVLQLLQRKKNQHEAN